MKSLRLKNRHGPPSRKPPPFRIGMAMPRLVETRPFDSDVVRRLGAKPRVSISVLAHLLGVVGLFSVPVLAQTTTAPVTSAPPVAATQLPTGGQVNAGQATLSQSGNTLNVNQTSQRAVVDWNTFNVGKDATVNFQQPNAQSATLNRVSDAQPSQILGRITAPGSVVLVNPEGVYFGKSSSVDVGGLVATTHNTSNKDFMDGQLKLTRNGASGKVENEGELRAALGGYIALLAPEVRNNGVIVANLGTVAMAAGETFELKFDGGGALSRIIVSAAAINTLVENKNAIKAPGGLIILSAQAASRLQSGVVNNSGTIEAAGLVRRAGRILLEASSSIFNSGSIKADATAGTNAGPAGSISLNAPDVQNSGTLSATNLAASSFPESGSLAAENGRISIQADTFTQTSTGLLDVSAIAAQAGNIDIAAAQAIAVSGRIFANGVVTDPAHIVANALGGSIQLQASRRVDLTTAVLDASGEGGAGRIHIQADGVPTPADNPAQTPVKGVVLLNTNTVLRVNSPRAQAGRVEIEGDDITLDTGTLIEAKGATQGGTVLIGGDWQGGGTMRQATTVTMSADSTIDASATDNGNGGQVVLWSAVDTANSVTTVNGTIAAKAGFNGGNGGRVETSGHLLNIDGVTVDAGSVIGDAGLWLIDPYNYTVNSSIASTITSTLNTTSVTITTSSSNTSYGGSTNSGDYGDINLNGAVFNKTGSANTVLTLSATRHIYVDANSSFSSNSGTLSLLFQADSGNTGNGFIQFNGNIASTNGGYIQFGAGNTANLVGSGTVYVGGDVYFAGSSAQTISTARSNGSALGNITFYGQAIVGNTSGLTINSDGGNIRFYSYVDSAGQSFSQGYNSSGKNWVDAQAASVAAGGYLANIGSRLENMMAALAVNYNQAWLGARNQGSGVWQWELGPLAGKTLYTMSNSTSLMYTNWNPGEPNNCCTNNTNAKGFGGENALQFVGTGGQWNDLMDNSTTLNYWVVGKNLANSPLTINAGAGNVTFDKAVGVTKSLSNLSVTGNQVIFSSNIQVDNTGVTVTNSGASSIAGAISGSGGLTKAGAGTLTLSGTSSYTGATNVNAGTLKIDSAGKIYLNDITINLNVNSGAVLDVYNWGWQGSLGNLRFDPGNLVINGGTIRYSGVTGGDWRSFTVLSGGATFDNPASGVTWNLNNSAQSPVISGDLTFTGAGNTVMSHTLIGAGYSIIKNGVGTLTLGGNNTYTGSTNVNGGILSVSSSTGLGSTAGITTVASGASLEFTNNVTVPETITVVGAGALGAGALRNLSGVNALTGLVTITGATEIQSDAGSLTLLPSAGNAISGSYNLTFDGAGTTMVGPLGIGSASVTKQGTGTLNLLTANTYTGNTTLSSGTLGIYDNASIGTGALTAAGGTTPVSYTHLTLPTTSRV